MLTINVSGLDRLGLACDQLSCMEGLDRALKRSAETVRDRAMQNLPGVTPPTIEPGSAPLSWTVTSSSDHGWRMEWGQLSSAPQPWFGPAANASREDVVRNVTDSVAAAARALR